MTDQTNQTDNIKRVSTDTSPDGVYSGLRRQALSVSRTETEIAEPPADAPVWGILMETGYEGTTVTLFALADGTTSLYFSNGGGMIGGHAHETVRNANARLMHEANRDLKLFTLCDAFPIPATGRTIFYLLTDSGVLTAEASEDDLGYRRHLLSTLFHAGHDVITQFRLISEAVEYES